MIGRRLDNKETNNIDNDTKCFVYRLNSIKQLKFVYKNSIDLNQYLKCFFYHSFFFDVGLVKRLF